MATASHPTAQANAQPGHSGVICRQPAQPIAALGMAVDLMFRRKPFSELKFGHIVPMIRGQILRGHYLIAFRGDRPVGFSGWAECTTDIAERWMREGYLPTYEECKSGDCAMLMTVVSSERDTTFALIRAMRLRYPNRRIYFKREYEAGKARKAFAFNRIDATLAEPATDAGKGTHRTAK